MSGYMVATQYQGHRAFFMVNTENPNFACDEVNKVTGRHGAEAMAPLSDETLKHFDVRSGQPWMSFTTNVATGQVETTRFGSGDGFLRRLARLTHRHQMVLVSIRQRWLALSQIPAIRTTLIFLGWVLIACAPLLGIIPGPGGLIVFAAGAGLVLKYSGWAKRRYVHLKRRYPGKGAWADWGMRRNSARKRLAREQERIVAQTAQGN